MKKYENSALDLLYINKEAVIQFFIVMSRFEYAVKRVGYIQTNGFVAWRGFAKKLDEACVSQDDADALCIAIKYLDERPPQRLNSSMSWAVWDRPEFDSSLARAFMSITQVRNNLFHGRKGADRDRNDKLVEASLVVLEFLLATDSKLRECYLKD